MKNESLDTDLKVCSRCIYDERVSLIEFDDDGVCNYCHQVEKIKNNYGTGQKKGKDKFQSIVDDIKEAGKGKKYDCIVGISGGIDSSYLLYLVREYGLRPLAFHYDNTWNSAIATENMRKVLTALDIDLYTYVLDNKESDDIFRSFFFSDVAEIDGPTDLGALEAAHRLAFKFGIKYILEGHSYITEGITPVGRNYFDGKYIKSIHKKFGKLPMKSFPLMTFSRFMFWNLFTKIKHIRPYWYLEYSKEDAKAFLEKEYNWKYYGGHHLENRISSFYHGIYLPQKFNTDMRNNTLSALVRLGRKSRKEAWEEYNSPPKVEQELSSYFKKRLEISDNTYEEVMNRASKSWYEYPTYKKRFELLRPLFKILVEANLVPMSFYLKYCFPMKENKK